MPVPVSARDALAAEMLADLGKIHDSVNDLKVVMPAMVRELNSQLRTESENFRIQSKEVEQILLAYIETEAKKTVYEIKEHLFNVAAFSAVEAIKSGMTKATGNLEQTSELLNSKMKDSCDLIKDASKTIDFYFWFIIFTATMSSILGSSITLLVYIKYFLHAIK